MKTIKFAVKEPNKPWKIMEAENTLETFQDIVGGYIEYFNRDDNGLLYFCNEEGKIMGLEPNFLFYSDVIVGNVFAVRDDGEGDFASITEADEQYFHDLGRAVDME